jgi:hypothetical protein
MERLELLLSAPSLASFGKFSWFGSRETVVVFRAARRIKEGNTSNKDELLNSMQAELERIHGKVDRECLTAGLWEVNKWDAIWRLLADIED